MANDKKVIWTRTAGIAKRDPLLIGRRISAEWLKEKIKLIEVRFSGDLFVEFRNLLDAAKANSKNLPIVSLRIGLIGGMEKMMSLDRDLGLIAEGNGRFPCAITLFAIDDEYERKEVRKQVAGYLAQWIMNVVEPWAQKYGMGALVARLKASAETQNIELSDIEVPLVSEERKANYPLIASVISQRLVGEKLFEDMSCCELVANPESRANYVELMTLPERANNGDGTFSMVARISVCSMPYNKDLFLGVSATKRVWAKKAPYANAKMPRRVTGYVMSAGRPAVMVPVERDTESWKFADAYAAVQAESGHRLPATLAEAIAQREFNNEVNWWAGLPELPTLYKYISPRTVFEGDEAALLGSVSCLLDGIISPKHISLREVALTRQKKPLQEMLRLTDLDFGTAGDALVSEATNEEEEEVLEAEEAEKKRLETLQHYRNQNIRALQLVHAGKTPVLWILSQSPREQEIIRESATTLFGSNLTIKTEPLPAGTHGLRGDLDTPEGKAQARFNERVTKWETAANTIRQVSRDQPIIVLICAADKYNNRSEDPVNYYAGIHAISKIGANVHHVLPIEDSQDETSVQSFLHRTQSALLDVFLAHSGIIFGVKELVAQVIPAACAPRCVYGIQAVRSRARTRSGEIGVTFILYTRLVVATGVTEVQLVYAGPSGSTKRSAWTPLSKGLQWLGSQRQLHEGDDRWLKAVFADETKNTLLAINAEDPHAIVMIDWQSVAGLWRSLRDDELRPGVAPKLNGADLSTFAGMSFVRLRRGPDTLSLRTEARVGFDGWLEGDESVRTGEVCIDSYYTTNKVLAEVSDELLASDRPYGHFIVSMGYAKTVQVKRGFSCYRTAARMKKIGDGATYEQKVLPPAEMDAALPASVEITVLSTPNGLSPKNVAMLVMGLRIGYAHYNDWTTLPAPMFFRKKIEDYVIRFPEDEEGRDGDAAQEAAPLDSTDTVAAPAEDAVEESATETDSGTKIARLLTADAKDESLASVCPVDEILPDLGKPGTEVSEGTELLSKAKATEMPVLLRMRDPKVRTLVQRMMQEDPHVRVRVDLPFWVKPMGIFGPPTPAVRRGATTCWNVMRDFGYISRHGSKTRKPTDNDFLNWLSSLLPIPQAAYAFAPACSEIGGVDFEPLSQIILHQFNPGRPAEEQIGLPVLTPENLVMLTSWAEKNGHDDLMGWLIFQVAQYPAAGWCEAVIGTMTIIPGIKTEEALKYYLDVASAVNDALAQKNHIGKFQAVIRRRPKPAEPPPAPSEAAPATLEAPVASSPAPAQAMPSHAPTSSVIATPSVAATPVIAASKAESSLDSVVAASAEVSPAERIKTDLLLLIDELEPGQSSFEDALTEATAHLDALKVIHRQATEKNIQEEVQRKRMSAFAERCKGVLSQLSALSGQLELSPLSFVEPSFELLDYAEESIARIQDLIGDIAALNEQRKTIEAMPAPASITEHQNRGRIVLETWDAIATTAATLKAVLAESVCLSMTRTAGSTPDETEISTSVAAEAITPVPVEAPPVEVPVDVEEAVVLPSHESAPVAVAAPVDTIAIPEEPEVPIETSAAVAVVAAAAVDAASALALAPGKAHEPETPLEYPATEKETPDDDAVYDDLEAAQDLVEIEVGTLNKLMQRRLYGLASVHVSALRPYLEEFKDGEMNTHYIVLKALVESLQKMDCQFEFDPQLDNDLRTLVELRGAAGDELCDSTPISMAVLAAGLSSMLFATHEIQSGLVDILAAPLAGHPALSELINHIDTARRYGLVLTRDMFLISHIGDQAAIKQEQARFQRRASEWKDGTELYWNYAHKGFRNMHDEIFSPQSPVGRCLELIANGDTTKIQAAHEEARRKLEKPSATVDEYYRKVGERTRPEGAYRVQAMNNINVTRRFIESYLDHIQRTENTNGELVRNIQAFLVTLHRRLEEAQVEVTSIVATNSLAVLYREALLFALRCTLRLFDNSQPPVCIPQDKQKLLIQTPLNRDLSPAFNRIDDLTPELCSPLDVLDETTRWTTEGLSIDSADDNIDVALKEAMQVHIKAQRFLPAFYIEAALPRAMLSANEPLVQLYLTKKKLFAADLQHARQRVTHAMTLSALPQGEANRMQRVIEELYTCLQKDRTDRGIGHPEGEYLAYPDFPHAAAALRHNVLMPLEARLAHVAKQLEDDLNRYIEENRGLASVQDTQRIRAMIKSENAAVLRTAHDALAILRATHKLPGRIGTVADVAGSYDSFMAEVNRGLLGNKNPLEMLLERLRVDDREDDPNWLNGLDRDQRNEGAAITEAWLTLFTGPRKQMPENAAALEAVFHRLGISHPPTPHPETGRPNRTRFMLPERAFTFPTSSDDDMFIPPVLGSWATHIQGFVVHGLPQESDLRQLMHDVGATPTVIMARTRLNMQKRARVCGLSPVLLIDDELVGYIALHPAERLKALMQIAVLTFSTNPYDDYGGRPVPPEMFFGRQTELSKLRDVKSLGVLYGGRRLGKSSLLSQVERETNAVPGSTATYISMDTIDSSSDHVLAAWEFIYRNLRARKIVSAMPPGTAKWPAIRDWIEKDISANPHLKSLYLLIDEADALMGRELKPVKGEVGFVRSLQQMVDNLHHTCHVRYVIAGLHNMARMTNEENSVLGKAEPIPLQPFNSGDLQRGIRLITKPLEAMGFLFKEGCEDLPLHILSVCNFYPAFIQLYCRCLVDRLQNNRQDSRPPLYITADDLDAVEKDSTLLAELQRKFELNLDLDKRYKAIALILADTYYSKIDDGHYQGLTISEIAELCETYATEHFRNATLSVYEALLDEMGKLNVTDRVGTRYVLRNTNIAMMMGDRARVSHKLDELAKEPPEDTRNHGERRVFMDNGTARVLFPFPMSWVRRYMNAEDGEVLVVTGNDLSGVLDLSRPTGREEWKVGQDGVFLMMPGSGPLAASDYIAKLRRTKDTSTRRIVAVKPNCWTIAQIPDFVAAAAKAVKQGIEVRFLLLAMPERAYEMAMAMDAGTLVEEAGKWRMVAVPQWSEDALFFHMHENTEVSENSEALCSLINASCGFHREIQRVCGGKTTLAEIPRIFAAAKEYLTPSKAEFYRKVGLPPSFGEDQRKAVEGVFEAIGGAGRYSSEVADICEMEGITKGELSFMNWMGLLQDGPSGTWKIPALYAALLKE